MSVREAAEHLVQTRSTKTVFSEAYAKKSSLISYKSKHKGFPQCCTSKLKDTYDIGEEAENDRGRKEGLRMHERRKLSP